MKLLSKIKLHSLTIIFFLTSLLTGYFKYLIMVFAIVIIHELGHIFFATVFKRKIKSLTILPFGGMTKIDCLQSTSIFEDLLIAIGGIFFQLILAVILEILSTHGLIEKNIYDFLNAYNKMILTFNLVPICPLDGFKIVKLLEELFLPFKLTFKTSFLLSSILLGIVVYKYFYIVKSNIFIFIFLILMTLEEIRNSKFIVQKFYLERFLYDFSYPKKEISKEENMYKNRTNYINGIHEKKYLQSKFASKLK